MVLYSSPLQGKTGLCSLIVAYAWRSGAGSISSCSDYFGQKGALHPKSHLFPQEAHIYYCSPWIHTGLATSPNDQRRILWNVSDSELLLEA